MPSAFEAATEVANADASTIAPLTTDLSPVKVDLPPDGVGPMDLREAAANLFAIMKKADAVGAASIAFAPVPMDGLGEAINDRLMRAAAPRE